MAQDESPNVKKLIVITDACCRIPEAHKPGRAKRGKAAFGAIYLNGEKELSNKVDEISGYLGEATVSEAEYRALIQALNHATSICRWELEVWSDSEFMIKQLNSEYRLTADNMKPLFDEVKKLEHRYESITYFHHKRDNVCAAEVDKLANNALDKVL